MGQWFQRQEYVHRLNVVVGSSFLTLVEVVPSSELQPGCVLVPVAQPSLCFMKPDFLYCSRTLLRQELDAKPTGKYLKLAHAVL